jgi:glycine betaine/proline transport system permease protein
MTAIAVPVGRRAEIRLTKGVQLAILFGIAAALYAILRGQWTLAHANDAPIFLSINDIRDTVDANRLTSPVFVYLFNPIRQAIGLLVDVFSFVLESVSWIGVTAIAGAMGLVFVTWRTCLLVVASFFAFGLLGLWEETVQTLALTMAAVVISLAIGIPLGIWAGRSDRLLRVVSPILDVMQIMPTFAYLAPLTLFFLIGSPAAVVATMIYAIPPAIRITALGIRGVPHDTVEAATSMGSTGWQVLRNVQLPMARSTIGLAVNQTIMMALSMIVITAFIDAPGLGQSIITALSKLNVGAAFEAGLAIVLLATVLDRLTASASSTTDRRKRGMDPTPTVRRRRIEVATIGVAVGAVVVGAILPLGEQFPDDWRFRLAAPINTIVAWIEKNLYPVTDAVKNVVTQYLLGPLETLLTTSPWWLVLGLAVGVALIVSGRRAALASGVALLAVVALQLWEHTMATLALVIVAVVITMLVGVALGVASARSDRFAQVLRPINDAAQTMPSFVYLLPAVALFGTTRFTGILAAVIYAAPAVTRLVEDGIRGVSPAAIEAATAAGSSRAQMILKVQLPMARRSLLVATNQGVVLVLAMVVVAGLVGAGALGYDVVAGFSQSEDFGKGMAAAISIVLLGVLLDRITQGAGARSSGRDQNGGRPLGLVSMPMAILGVPARALVRRSKPGPE